MTARGLATQSFDAFGLAQSHAGVDGDEFFVTLENGMVVVGNAVDVDAASTTPGRGYGIFVDTRTWAKPALHEPAPHEDNLWSQGQTCCRVPPDQR